MCSLEKWSRFSFRYVNFNVHMDLLNIFSSLWELISFGALALPGRTCLFCLTPELDSVLAILAKSCLGAVLCQMWVWKNGTPFHWVSVYTEVSWNFIPLSFSTYFSHTFFILFSYCPYTEVFPIKVLESAMSFTECLGWLIPINWWLKPRIFDLFSIIHPLLNSAIRKTDIWE